MTFVGSLAFSLSPPQDHLYGAGSILCFPSVNEVDFTVQKRIEGAFSGSPSRTHVGRRPSSAESDYSADLKEIFDFPR